MAQPVDRSVCIINSSSVCRFFLLFFYLPRHPPCITGPARGEQTRQSQKSADHLCTDRDRGSFHAHRGAHEANIDAAELAHFHAQLRHLPPARRPRRVPVQYAGRQVRFRQSALGTPLGLLRRIDVRLPALRRHSTPAEALPAVQGRTVPRLRPRHAPRSRLRWLR